jgi:hypothetical protein
MDAKKLCDKQLHNYLTYILDFITGYPLKKWKKKH